LNKFDIVKILAKEKNLSEKDALAIINSIVNEITQSLHVGERVEFRGFGVFSVKENKSREARNPKTGQKISVNKKKIPQFKMAKAFYEYINQ